MDPWEDSLNVYVYSAPNQYYQMEGKKVKLQPFC